MLIIAALVIAALVGIDQWIKFLVVEHLKPIGETGFIKIGDLDIMHLHYIENTGSAFGSLAGQRGLLLTVTILGVGACVYALCRHAKRKPLLLWSLVLVIGGALGNMIDRLFRKDGAVVDYLDVQLFDFAVFNFADICVCIGTALLFVYILFFMDKEPKPQNTDVSEEEAEHDEA